MRTFKFNSTTELFDNLMALSVDPESGFFHVDHGSFRVFSYRLVSWSQFDLPDALNSRGTTFQLNSDGRWVLVALPMHKFFNLHEGEIDKTLNYVTDVLGYQDKLDGSLISSCLDFNKGYAEGHVTLKSKTSFTSTMAVDAMEYLEERPEYLKVVKNVTMAHFTVNFEWTAPSNRIVLSYTKPALTVLNVRSMLTGEYMLMEDVKTFFGEFGVSPHTYILPDENPEEFIKEIPNIETAIEGYVIHLTGGEMVKVKTNAYVRLHKMKDSINSDKNLFELIMHDQVDDVLSAFHYDEIAVARIKSMQNYVVCTVNGIRHTIDGFYVRNQHLTRKDYAILAKELFDGLGFTLAMHKYLNRMTDEAFTKTIIKYPDYILQNYNET